MTLPQLHCHAYFKYFQVLTNVQTAYESPDLNMDFRPFKNGLHLKMGYTNRNFARIACFLF